MVETTQTIHYNERLFFSFIITVPLHNSYKKCINKKLRYKSLKIVYKFILNGRPPHQLLYKSQIVLIAQKTVKLFADRRHLQDFFPSLKDHFQQKPYNCNRLVTQSLEGSVNQNVHRIRLPLSLLPGFPLPGPPDFSGKELQKIRNIQGDNPILFNYECGGREIKQE